MHRYILFSLTLLTLSFGASTTPLPTIAINSGNPAFPFPQFQPYQNASGTLGNLADNNGVGVPHAEMEQTIRDGYRIMMNRATKPGGGVGGIDYIKFRSNPQCSEGDGYGLLGAASMADKTTFDGMWLYIHDFTLNKVKRYRDCQDASPGYKYSQLPGWTGAGDNSAADGDFDIAVALLQAYRQWGEFMGISDACGKPISYKQAAIDFLKGLTDTLPSIDQQGISYNCGDIGLDGYFKGGDTWIELTNWATNTTQSGFPKPPEFKGPGQQHIDYTAPSYFHQFADFLAEVDSAKYAWNIFQFRRATASSDWLMGQLYQASPRNIPYVGWVQLSASNQATFSQFNEGEDFRLAWRTILNYLWNGNPTSTWDPATHLVKEGTPNSFERDIGLRYAKFLWKAQQSPWNNPCVLPKDGFPLSFWGPAALWTNWKLDGSGGNFFPLNWIKGTGSISAVVAQDYSLMAELYRQCEVVWHAEIPNDGYLNAVPFYFHEWFRLMGMLVLSGNYHAPSAMKRSANMKVYISIDKTFGFEKDSVTYNIGYRNYGMDTARNVTIVDTLHKDFVFLSATRGGVHNTVNNTVTWNIGNVPWYQKTDNNGPMQDSVKLIVKVGSATLKQYRNRAAISCSNGTGWTSNEYPNRKTSVMERNYLDIAKRALVIKKKASKLLIKPGAIDTFTIKFENTSEAGWINGGRPGVHFSYSRGDNVTTGHENKMRFRLFHDANEGYIDYGNYRFSYYLYDSLIRCLKTQVGCTNGWDIQQGGITEGVDPNFVRVFQENITPGRDSLRRWNQRIVVQFSDPTNPKRTENLAVIDWLLLHDAGNLGTQIHKGGMYLLRLVRTLTNDYGGPNAIWNDDWSWDPKAVDKEDGLFWPITNDWTNPDSPDVKVTTWNPKSCEIATHTVNNILVEEWDGYTWRRVAGNGPMPGRDAYHVAIRDTIPAGFRFNGFIGPPPLGVVVNIDPTQRIISWKIDTLQIMQKDSIKYSVIANGSCPGTPRSTTINRAWIVADKESPFLDSVIVVIDCDTTPMLPKPDHLDIIIDTTAIDPRNDAPFQRVTMDAGSLTINAWVVIRDSLGNLLDSIRSFTWTSRDPAVATVTGAGWQATITKAGEGSTIITVTASGLKPDSMSVTAVATPPWPAIVSAVMRDNNADIIPDMLLITLTDTFKVNQRFDSIAITYRGNGYSIPASAVTRSGTVLSIPFTTLTGVDARPSGLVSLVMTVEAAEKRESKAFTDGVCPALLSADVLENDGTGNDILYLIFTEAIDQNVLIGKQLQLIKMPGGAVITLDINGIVAAQNDSMVSVEVTPAAQRPLAGDSLRLVPGSMGGIIADRARNRPHDLNRAVLLGSRAGPSSIASAWYIDGNADGVIDSVKIAFKRAVLPAELSSAVIQWDLRYYTVPIASIVSSGASLLTIPVAGTVTDPGRIATGGAMDLTVKYTQFPDIIRTAPVADSAAPVIDSATLFRGTYTQTGAAGQDTLVVKFSERAPAVSGLPYLVLSRASMTEYAFQGAMERSDGIKYRYVVTSAVAPGIGDSIWIDRLVAPGVSDAGLNVQRNALNRRVLLKSVWPLSEWTIRITFNPFDPDTTKLPADFRTALGAGAPVHGTGISARTNSPLDPAFIDATITLYDAVGNIMAQKPMTNANGALYFAWDGTRNGRRAGSGTYLAIIRIRENGKQLLSKRVALGVRRAR